MGADARDARTGVGAVFIVLPAAGGEALRRQLVREHPDADMSVAIERARERMTVEAEVFIAALEHDIIDAEDFGSG